MIGGFACGCDGSERITIGECHGSAEAVGGELFGDGEGKGVDVLEEQCFEPCSVLVFAAVGEFSGCGDLRIFADAVGDLLGAPASDGVVVLECEAERVDFCMARCAVRIMDVGFEFFAEGGFWAGGICGDGVHVCGRWGR